MTRLVLFRNTVGCSVNIWWIRELISRSWRSWLSRRSGMSLCWLFYLSVSPARRAPHPNQATIGFTTLSVPLTGDRNPSRKGKDVTALQCCGCPTCPSPGGGSLTHSQALALSKRARDVTALRCSEPLRFMVGGASKPSPCFAGWDRRGIAGYS